MKKSLIASTMILGICSLINAQVGINTVENAIPKVTLQVDGKPDQPSVQDGILVPRITRVQLAAKDTVYSADQNGALIFITDISGTSTPKTADITSTGFYYYNSSTLKWTAVAPASSEAKDYGKGSFTPNSTTVNVSQTVDWTSYASYNYIELVNPSGVSNSTLNFPSASAIIGTLYLYNNCGQMLTFDGSPLSTKYLTYGAALHLYSDGTKWYLMAGRD
ncbi:hypothetical protein O2K51_08885 [Apibacter raozihei]|uniref:hypothetical protein n=1 Tax=Apibacter raozihei TaxID=2500547 RepID=UPI000FE354C0|nr:hypothetical protein [Apibacter raozihei]